MIALYFLEFVVNLLILAFLITQVIVPIWKGTILFPFFRSKTKKIERELALARDDIASADAEVEVLKLHELAETKRSATRKRAPTAAPVQPAPVIPTVAPRAATVTKRTTTTKKGNS